MSKVSGLHCFTTRWKCRALTERSTHSQVGADDTTADIRRKVASAAELCEDGFDTSFGGKVQ